MFTKTITYAAAFAIATSQAQAAEFKDKNHELWKDTSITINDSDGNKVLTVTAGEIKLYDDRIVSAKPTDPTKVLTDAEIGASTQANVVRIKSILSSKNFSDAFTLIQDKTAYSYNNFLKAAQKYPNFCNETKYTDYNSKIHSITQVEFNLKSDADKLSYSLDQTCRHELATMFAHWTQETGYNDKRDSQKLDTWQQALYYTEEWGCHQDDENEWGHHCKTDYRSESWSWAYSAFPMEDDAYYYGRGPLQLSWNYNYGAFSQLFHSNDYDSKSYYLKNPDNVITDDGTLMEFMMWFYMTPQPPKPCMHSIATGNYVPNETDKKKNFRADFGTTINVINGDLECGSDFATWKTDTKAQQRVGYYKKWLSYFKLPENNDTIKCSDQTAVFPREGYAGKRYMYFSPGSGAKTGECGVTYFATAYKVVNDYDYKRCVCDNFDNKGAADCMTE